MVWMTGLVLALVLLAGPGAASAADEQSILQAISRDTGVTAEKLQEEKTETGLTYGDLRMGHLVAEALNRAFEDVTKEFKGGQPWHEMARRAGLSLKDVERVAQRRRQANPLP
jgi:hypothetical protein